jgi:hypothetical protein
MNQLDIRNALLQAVIDNKTVPLANENSGFKPIGLDSYISTHFIPATSEPMGKLQASNDDDRGIFQISVFVKLNADDYDNEQIQIIDAFKTVFFNSAVIGGVFINEVTTNGGYPVESWYKRDISINYMAFTTR